MPAYLQKLRESADFTYLDRASRLVNGILEKDDGAGLVFSPGPRDDLVVHQLHRKRRLESCYAAIEKESFLLRAAAVRQLQSGGCGIARRIVVAVRGFSLETSVVSRQDLHALKMTRVTLTLYPGYSPAATDGAFRSTRGI